MAGLWWSFSRKFYPVQADEGICSSAANFHQFCFVEGTHLLCHLNPYTLIISHWITAWPCTIWNDKGICPFIYRQWLLHVSYFLRITLYSVNLICKYNVEQWHFKRNLLKNLGKILKSVKKPYEFFYTFKGFFKHTSHLETLIFGELKWTLYGRFLFQSF